MKKRSFYLDTYGCQMNLYDSEIIASLLTSAGFEEKRLPEEADLILLNTCVVRRHAEERVIGRLEELKGLKKRNPHLLLGICGCLAQQKGKEIRERFPQVALVIGTEAFPKIPQYALEFYETQTPICDLSPGIDHPPLLPASKGVSAFVVIMRGCNNFCSYCIVPYVRGRERSKPPHEILQEIRNLVRNGVKEVTLLGQNVNSYRSEKVNFAQLLRAVEGIEGLKRIRFLTSHPRDLSLEVLEVMSNSSKICEHLHLPLQSGSSKILERMNRGYTSEEYLRRVELARAMIPGISITTDLIVGFPGEEEEDFQATKDLMERVEFDAAYLFKFSPRQGTKALEMSDQIPESIKQERLESLIFHQKKITEKKNRKFLGKEEEILVESESKRNPSELMGKTRTNRNVIFKRNGIEIGSLIRVKIVEMRGLTLFGQVISSID